MYAPRVFLSMLSVLAVFFIAAYMMTGSLFIALIETFLCAIILQVGYFIGVLYLVRREKTEAKSNGKPDAKSPSAASGSSLDQIRADAAARLRTND